ncbi:MAG: MFS transporter, partial [Planctomycetota bacterium]|nr:MFS transporter [Planctomycetota bacterium]
MPFHVRFRLSTMMFLLYAVWGSWAVVAYPFFVERGFSETVIGWLFSLPALACIVAPFIGGQIADRWFPTQKVIAVLQLLGGVILILIANTTAFAPMMWLMLFYSLVYAPTLALTNSIAFINLKDSDKDFGKIRVWGTIGWIAAGLALAAWR